VKEGIAAVTGFTFVENTTQLKDKQFSITGSSKVGATVANDIKSSSVQAIILALLAIFLYILMRFRKWQFSLGAIVALAHDALFVIAAFSIAGTFGASFEIDQVFIAAILTVIGYSINDTVVIFDRIREYLSGRKNAPIEGTINDALNSTLGRSINTSMTVLLTLLVMFIFGSDDIRGFCFAMIIGVISGVYSTLFIASPIVVDMRKWASKKAEA
jgi:SecD/SecF fusion protein